MHLRREHRLEATVQEIIQYFRQAPNHHLLQIGGRVRGAVERLLKRVGFPCRLLRMLGIVGGPAKNVPVELPRVEG